MHHLSIHKTRIFYAIIGGLIGMISLNFLFQSGYHVFYYDHTGGVDEGVFRAPRPYSEVILVFAFWLLILVGGIGIITNQKKGLIIGLFATIVGFLSSLIYLVILGNHNLQYSTRMLINHTEREMTVIEKWNMIYKEPFLYLGLTILLFVLIIALLKRIKSPNHNQS